MSKQAKAQAEGAFFYKGKRYLITSEREQVFNLLLSTYELIVMKNRELKEGKEKLEILNDNLEKMVEERTAELAIVNEGLRNHHFWFCRRFETIYSNIGVHQTITAREENVPGHLKISLFRIIQEAMNNIGKHAQTDRIDLGLQKLGGTLELLIGDNGKGFDPEALSSRESFPKGLGLSSMKERVEFSGGTLTIESATGKGTVLKAVWSSNRHSSPIILDPGWP